MDPDPELRRAHQTAVCVLARFGGARALPSLLVALDGGVDAWRAFQVAGRLPQESPVLVPRLCGHLRDADLTRSWFEGTAPALLDALSRLGDASAVPAISDTLAVAARDQHRDSTVAALKALAPFGPAAVDAVGAENSIRPGQAACRYSWMVPPSRSRLRMFRRWIRTGSVIASGRGRSGAAWSSVRCGRWVL